MTIDERPIVLFVLLPPLFQSLAFNHRVPVNRVPNNHDTA